MWDLCFALRIRGRRCEVAWTQARATVVIGMLAGTSGTCSLTILANIPEGSRCSRFRRRWTLPAAPLNREWIRGVDLSVLSRFRRSHQVAFHDLTVRYQSRRRVKRRSQSFRSPTRRSSRNSTIHICRNHPLLNVRALCSLIRIMTPQWRKFRHLEAHPLHHLSPLLPPKV